MSTPNASMVNEMWKLFQNKKVRIASEIKQAYPFFHILRDKEVILPEDFEECLRKINSNSENIDLVVYNVLEGIKNESTMWELFCKENLDAYPNLQPIYQELKNVLQCGETSCASERRTEVQTVPPTLPPTPAFSPTSHCSTRGSLLICQQSRDEAPSFPLACQLDSGQQGRRNRKQKKNQISNLMGPTLRVYCGKEARGVLYKKKLAAGIINKSIKTSDGRWLTPAEFESEGGCRKWKNWKKSIRCGNYTIEELIKRGVLAKPPLARCRRDKDSRLCLQKKKITSCPGLRIQTQNPSRQFHQSTSDQTSGSANVDLFASPELLVQCGTVSGKLHKYRFEAGPQKKSIRMEERWCTPEEFVEMGGAINSGSWDSVILVSDKPLKELIKNGVLKVHREDCCCDNCKEVPWPENDDICSVCLSGGSLICCDSCPKSFHGSCHVPDVSSEESKKWICTFCKWKSKRSSNTASSRDDQVQRYKMLPLKTLKCAFLLLKIWCQTESIHFAEDPTMKIPNYGSYIKKPMWLKKVKQKLQQKRYERVGDFKGDMCLIFKNFQQFNQGKEIAKEGRKLQEKFEKIFQEVFLIKQPVTALYRCKSTSDFFKI